MAFPSGRAPSAVCTAILDVAHIFAVTPVSMLPRFKPTPAHPGRFTNSLGACAVRSTARAGVDAIAMSANAIEVTRSRVVRRRLCMMRLQQIQDLDPAARPAVRRIGTIVRSTTDKKLLSRAATWSLFERCQFAGALSSRWSAASTRNMKCDAPPPITYSPCCQRNGKSLSSGKSGRMRFVPETTPPGM